MLILDENIPKEEKYILRKFKKSFKQIGFEFEISGIKDNVIIPLLHKLKNPTFFSLDKGFNNTKLLHKSYSIVCLYVNEEKTAEYIIKFLKHKSFNTISKRIGKVIQITTQRIRYREVNSVEIKDIFWE